MARIPMAEWSSIVGGNLWGTTQIGGNGLGPGSGFGTVLELSPQSDGTWNETTLFLFTGEASGFNPWDGLRENGGGIVSSLNSSRFTFGILLQGRRRFARNDRGRTGKRR